VVVDADSDDKTKKVINKFKKSLKIRIINSKKRNISFQRNLGLKNSRYEQVLFLDADTKFDDNFLENSLSEIKTKNLNIAGARLYPDSRNILDQFFFLLFRIYSTALHKHIGLNGCCIFTLKSLHNKVNGFDESIKVSEDYDYTKRLRKLTSISLLNTKVYTSVRRFEKNGRVKTALKIFLIGLYINFIGNVKMNIFNYRFNEK
jgi:glycosyltransferase involved in cell wall biosynthesis